jgi:hypothetical protein
VTSTVLTSEPTSFEHTGLPRPWRRTIVESLVPVVGEAPILLLGSRAIGSAEPDSDCDVAVVLPATSCLRLASRLNRRATELSGRLGAPVSVSPLPAAHLAKPRGSLYLLKVHREAVQLAGQPVVLHRDSPVALSRLAAASFAVTAVVTLLEVADLDPASQAVVRAVRKAALQVAQLRLCDRRTYASTLDEALALLGAAELCELAASPETPGTFTAVRGLVLREAGRRAFTVPRRGVPLRNAQASLLAALRGSPSWGTMLSPVATEELLARLLGGLLESSDPQDVPPELRRRLSLRDEASWHELRDAACGAWRRCHALGGVL